MAEYYSLFSGCPLPGQAASADPLRQKADNGTYDKAGKHDLQIVRLALGGVHRCHGEQQPKRRTERNLLSLAPA